MVRAPSCRRAAASPIGTRSKVVAYALAAVSITVPAQMSGLGHLAPEASGEQQGEETLNPNCRGRVLRADCVGEPAQMDEADRPDANADREHTQHTAAQLRRRGAIDDRRLHDAECG